MNKNTAELLKLIQQNPDLPVIPMVNGEIPADDSVRWLGSWGNACVDEYLLANKSACMAFKSDDDVFFALEQYLSDEEFEKLPETEEECRDAYNALPWIKAIIVNIDFPD